SAPNVIYAQAQFPAARAFCPGSSSHAAALLWICAVHTAPKGQKNRACNAACRLTRISLVKFLRTGHQPDPKIPELVQIRKKRFLEGFTNPRRCFFSGAKKNANK